MKKASIVILLSALMLLPMTSFADTSTSSSATTTRKSPKESVKDHIDERKEAIKQAVAEKREEIAEKVRTRLSDHILRVVERHNAALSRLNNLAERIESRIGKMDTEGASTTKVKELLTIAKTKISEAEVSVAAISTKSKEMLAGDIRALYPELKEVIEVSKNDLKEAHAALVDVILNLRPGQNKPKGSNQATTTATTTNN